MYIRRKDWPSPPLRLRRPTQGGTRSGKLWEDGQRRAFLWLWTGSVTAIIAAASAATHKLGRMPHQSVAGKPTGGGAEGGGRRAWVWRAWAWVWRAWAWV